MEKIQIELVIEKSEGLVTGRVNYNSNLIVEQAASVQTLEDKFKVLLQDFEGVEPSRIEFAHAYDVYGLFKEFNFLKISQVAKRAGINAALMRHYASQIKHPGEKQAKKIEDTIHLLASEMLQATVTV